ncbi:MAG: hypothetical protein FGM14_10910 [Flavobacteriales bacterium]|nr:hypothetical protein [Flavobacteriales bacterium]
MISALAGKPKVIFQYSLEMMFDEKFLASIEKIAAKIDSDELFERCLIYLRNVERTGLADLSKTLSKLDEAGKVGEELVEEIIVNPKIRRLFNSMDDPEELVDLWHNYYKTKPTQSFSEYVSLQLKIGENVAILTKFPDFLSWSTLQKNLAIIKDADSSLFNLINNSNFLSKNKELQEALNTHLNMDLIGSTKMLQNARAKVMKKLNQVLGENLNNVDELLEVLQNVKNPASYGSIGLF